MRFHVLLKYIGYILLLNSCFLFISFLIAWYNNDTSMFALLYSTVLNAIFGVFPLIFVPKVSQINNKEGYFIVVLSWLVSCLFGTIPYILWGGDFTFTNAIFEVVSGFTTTGSTILADIESLPYGLLFWRASTHWIGGIGIVIFAMVILPAFTGGAKTALYNKEMSPLAMENFQYRTKKALQIILVVYLGLTLLQIIALCLAGMNLFDSVCHTFATVATGGFSTKNISIAYYDSLSIEIIIMVFMLFSGMHFGLLFATVTLNKPNIFTSSIIRYYVLANLVGIVLVAWNVRQSQFDNYGDAFRYASFQVISLGTTTGFATIDTAIWPGFAKMILIFFTIQCACSGSTAGGIKVDRVVLFFRSVRKEIKLAQHPNAIVSLSIDNNPRDEIVESTLNFIVLYILIIFISTTLLSLMDIDLLTAFSATITCIGNVGPGFERVSSLGNFGSLPDAAKWILSFDMLLGRLEIYGLILLFYVRSWK